MRLRWSVIAAVVLGLVPVPAANAATVRAGIELYTISVIRIEAKPDERNDFVVTVTDVVRVTDSVPLEAGQGCYNEPGGSVACDLGFVVPPAPLQVYVDAGDLDDAVRIGAGDMFLSAHLDGGNGNDLLTGGGVGEYFFIGGSGDDRMVGGKGRNEFLEGASANGSDRFEGGRGAYVDSVRYDSRSRGVRVTLDGEANDGERGERDSVSPSVSSVYAGGGADVLIGNKRANGLIGAGGADVLRGAGGNDQLSGGNRLYGRVGSDDRLYGGAGSDMLRGNAGDDLLVGGPGRDDLDAFSGSDRLLLGPGRDSARAGPGDDFIHARDRSSDAISCGLGHDMIRSDPFDRLLSLCERPRRAT